MTRKLSETLLWQLILISLIALSCSLINSRGTLDVHTWIRWTHDYLTYGPFEGYAHNKTDYPPLMIYIFYLFTKVFTALGAGDFISVKITVLTFSLFATSLIFYWTRHYALTTLFHLIFIINTVGLGYADIILSFFLLLALLALKHKRFIIFSLCYTTAIFIKWQALIISPFLLVYLFNLSRTETISRLNLLSQLLLPACTITSVIIYAFNYPAVFYAFTWALHHPWLSGYALNIHWVLTFLFRVLRPELFGGLVNGEVSYIATENIPLAFLLAKGIFVAGFFYMLYVFSRTKANFENLLIFSLTSYLLYFTFNTGVHENHLFLAFVLSFLLCIINRQYLALCIYIGLAFNINMIFFYGFNGHFNFSRVIYGLDSTVIFAVTNTMVFSYFCVSATLKQKHLLNAP